MHLKSLLLGTSLLALVPVLAYAEDRLQPRAEIGVKAGSERSVLTTEFWAPLAQKSDRVVYTDVRLMGDDDSNREGNLGFGYRQIYAPTNSVLGVHGWIDRRRTEHGNNFHEITLGVESLGSSIDLRANGYIALDNAKTAVTPNLGPTTPYLAGTGLFYNTNGSITETPQYGVDAEAGYRLPLFEKHVDTVRVYGGGYHFFRSNTDNVTGIRIRTEAQINPALSVGARFQHDGPRGSQGFLEATLKFPFSAKKMFRTSGLRARLDESPERDIDIVTGAKVDNGQRQIQNSTTGDTQRILYVDNTNTQSGDGSYENPFSNLKAAEAALKANDILYVKAGNGTTTGMDQGINITQAGVSLIGSGSALTVGGITFLNAGSAPVITNNQTYTEDLTNNIHTGNGIFITGDNAFITGINVSGAQGNGIYALANGSSNIFNGFTAINNNASGSINGSGIYAAAFNGAGFNFVNIENNITNDEANTANGRGISVLISGTNSQVGSVLLQGNYSSNNNNDGMRVRTELGATAENITFNSNISTLQRTGGGNGLGLQIDSGSKVNTANFTNNNSSNNTGVGIFAYVTGLATLQTLNFSDSITNGNKGSNGGIFASTGSAGQIQNINVQNITSSGNSVDGYRSYASGTGSYIGQVTIRNVVTSTNSGSGVNVYGYNGGSVNVVDIASVTASNNTSSGVVVNAIPNGSANGASIGTVKLDNISAINNAIGVRVSADSTGATASTIGQATLTNIFSANNVQHGVYLNANNGATINQVSVDNVTTLNNKINGLYLYAFTGSVNQASITNIIANNNNNFGVSLRTEGVSGYIGTLTASGISANNNTGSGVDISSLVNATLDTASLSNVTASGNSSGVTLNVNNSGIINNVTLNTINASNSKFFGIYTLAQGNGRIGTANIINNTITGNANHGIYSLVQGSSTRVNTLNISGNTSNNNVGNGILTSLTSNTTLNNVVLNNNTTNANALQGNYLLLATASNLPSATITNNTSNNNTGSNGIGFYVRADNTSTLSAIFANNNATGNAQNGLYVYKNTSGTFVVDAGGGSLSSVGGNRIFNSTGTEVRIDGGYALQAQNNYWGGGDLAGGERTLNGGSTITTTGFLTVDPRP